MTEIEDDPAREPSDEPTKSAREPERIIAVVRPAMFRAHPFRFLGIALVFVAGVGGAIAAKIGIEGTTGTVVALAAFLVALAAIVAWATWWIGASLWMRVEITNLRTVRYEGIVRRHSTEVLHDHVRSVDIRQGFLQRVMNVGTVGIDSAGQDGIEIEIDDMPDPYGIKKVIDRYRG